MTSSKRSSVAESIKQGKPFQSRQQELYISLARTASELSLSTERFLRAFGVTQIQYNVLRILQGSDPAGLGRNEISERMITPAPDMTRLLDRMERDGLVVRKRDSEDKRQVVTTITSAGKKLLANVETPLMELHTQQFASLSSAEVQTASRWLDSIREGLL